MRLTLQHYRNHFINSPSSQPQSNPLYPLGQQIQFDMHQWDDVRYRACSECVQWSRPERHLFVGICVCVYVCDWHSVSLRSRLDREPLDSLQACLLIWSACSDHSRGKAPSLSPSPPHCTLPWRPGGFSRVTVRRLDRTTPTVTTTTTGPEKPKQSSWGIRLGHLLFIKTSSMRSLDSLSGAVSGKLEEVTQVKRFLMAVRNY